MTERYEAEMVERIRDVLIENFEAIDMDVRLDTVVWVAQSVYDELEDELAPE